MYKVILLLLALCLSWYPCALRAQTTNGYITGRVTDPSKATIPDAKVAAVNAGTNFRCESATNGAGEYLRVRDDGKGIDPKLLSHDGREGHFGLRGMRERAKLVGGKLTIWTELDGGTEIELNIPGARAYVKATRPFWHFAKRSAQETGEDEAKERG